MESLLILGRSSLQLSSLPNSPCFLVQKDVPSSSKAFSFPFSEGEKVIFQAWETEKGKGRDGLAMGLDLTVSLCLAISPCHLACSGGKGESVGMEKCGKTSFFGESFAGVGPKTPPFPIPRQREKGLSLGMGRTSRKFHYFSKYVRIEEEIGWNGKLKLCKWKTLSLSDSPPA